MKAVLKLEGLCCANCAAKIEREVQKIQGVEEATVAFMTQKLTVIADDGRMEDILSEAERIARKIESDVTVKRIK